MSLLIPGEILFSSALSEIRGQGRLYKGFTAAGTDSLLLKDTRVILLHLSGGLWLCHILNNKGEHMGLFPGSPLAYFKYFISNVSPDLLQGIVMSLKNVMGASFILL